MKEAEATMRHEISSALHDLANAVDVSEPEDPMVTIRLGFDINVIGRYELVEAARRVSMDVEVEAA